MNVQPNRGEYKRAIYKFGELFIYRHLRPWLKLPLIRKMSSVSQEVDETVDVLHDFSTSIIQDRKKAFAEFRNQTKQLAKRMSLIDLLLDAENNDEIEIDDNGIREEIDTFMFEVNTLFAIHSY